MSVHNFSISIVLWWCLACLASCTPEPDPDPPPTTTTSVVPTPPPTTTTPPEPDGPKPSDYIRISRAPQIVDWQSSENIGLRAGAQTMIWSGSRDIVRVLERCPWAWGEFLPMSIVQAENFAVTGARLTQEAESFIPRLSEQNRRCRTTHPEYDPGFCLVSNVRKSAFQPFGALGNATTPRGEFWRHLDAAHGLSNVAGQCRGAIRDAGGSAYDSLAGWCGSMNELGWASEGCSR